MPITEDEVAGLLADESAPGQITEADVEQLVAPAGVGPGDSELAALDGSGADPLAMRQLDEDRRIDATFRASLNVDMDRAAQVRKLATDFGIPTKYIDHRVEEFSASWKAAQFDPVKWGQENPDLKKLVLEHPELGPEVVRNQEVSGLMKALRGIFTERESGLQDELLRRELRGEVSTPEAEALVEQAKESREAATEKANAPKQVTLRQTPESEALNQPIEPGLLSGARENLRLLEVARQRYLEAGRGFAVAKEYSKLLRQRMLGQDTEETESNLVDLKQQAFQADFDEGPVGAVLRDVAEVTASSVEGLEGGGVGLAAAAAVGTAAGVVTKNPKTGVKVAKALAPWLGKTGVALSTMDLETGSQYQQLLEAKDESGEPLSEEVARYGAVVYGVVSTAIEIGSLNVQLGAMTGTASKAKVAQLIKQDPTFRALLLKGGAAWVKASAAEAGEEGLQTAFGQAVEYFAASINEGRLQSKSRVDVAEVAGATQKAFVGSLFGQGGVVGGVNLATQVLERGNSEAAGKRVAVIAKLADTEAIRSFPEAAAKMIERATAEDGEAVTALHIDAHAFGRMFQSELADPEVLKESPGLIDVRTVEVAAQKAEELFGPGAGEKFKEQLAAGGKLEVPLQQALERLGGTELLKKLIDDTTTRPWRETANEQKAHAAESEKRAQAIADANEEQATEKTAVDAMFDQLEQDLVATGKHSARDAGQLVLLKRKLYDTAAARFKVPAAQLFEQIRIQVGLGDTFDKLETPSRTSERIVAGEGLSVDARARDLFIDEVSGLRNVRSWDSNERVPGKEVAVVSLRAAKALNDDPEGGHDITNEVLQVMGGVVGGIDAEAARDGTKFRLHVAPGQLEAELAKLRAALPAGLEVEGATGLTHIEANDALKLVEDAKEKAGAIPARGQTRFDLATLKTTKFSGEKAKSQPTAEQLVVAGELSNEAFHAQAYRDADVPGVLNKVGFDASGPAKHVLAMDGVGLGEINDKYGKEVGTRYIQIVSKIAQLVGGTAVNFAHLSGDEYGAKHDNRLELESFAADLEIELHRVVFRAKNVKTGAIERVPLLIRFGVGEKTYGAADRALNTAKRSESETRGPRSENARVTRDRLLREGNLGAGSTRAQRRGARAQAFVGPARSGPDIGEAGPDVAFNAAELTAANLHSPEDIAIVRKKADGMRLPGKKAKAHAWLDFTLGLRKDRPEGITPAMERLFAEFGFVDPDVRTGDLQREKGHRRGDGRGRLTMDSSKKEALRKQLAGEAPDAFAEAGFSGSRKFQPPDGEGGSPANPRGWTQVVVTQLGRIFKVGLNKSADLSTFVHESGHVMLELFADLAARPDAPASLREDFATTLQYLGADPAAVVRNEEGWSFSTEHHEKWARSFEAYLREGKAPSADLVRAFERISLWLKQLYRNVLQLGVELNPEVRGVFDRLLATDDEIESYSSAMGLTAAGGTHLEAGMTPEQYEAHLAELLKLKSAVQRRIRLRALQEQLREKEAWWKAEERTFLEEAEADYEQRQDVKALRFLLRGEFRSTEDGPPVKVEESRLDRAAVEKMLGKDGARALFGKGNRLKADGLDPNEVADVLGFPSGIAMLEAAAKVPDRKLWVKAKALEAMAEAHPGVLNDREQLREEVGKGMHGDETAAWLLAEERTLRAKAKSGAPAPVQELRRAAELMASRRLVGRLGANDALRAERKAAAASARAAAKGDFGQAHVHKLQQLLNMFLFNELAKARDEVDAFTERATALTKTKARARIGKSSPVYLDGIDSLLEAIGLKPPEDVRDSPLKSIGEVVAQMVSDGTSVMLDEAALGWILGRARPLAPANPTELKKLTLGELRTVSDALRNIVGAATTRAKVLVDEKRVDKELVVEALENEGRTNQTVVGEWLGAGGIPSSASAANWRQRLAQLPSHLTGPLMKPELLASLMGGRDLKSMWFRAIVKPLVDGGVAESDLLKKTIKPILDAFNSMPAKVRKLSTQAFDGQAAFPGHAVIGGQDLKAPTTRFELLMMALNFGNASNISRLLEGRGITEAQVMAAINTLTKEELDWVQSVWDACEALKEPAFALEERDSGLRPKAIEARPLRTVHGTFRGGYFPAIYDKRVSKVGEEQAVNAFLDPGFGRYGTPHGHLKQRSDGFRDVLQLEPSVIPRHLAQVAHDIAFREAIKSVGGLVMDQRIQGLLKERLGESRARQFEAWLKDIGTARGAEEMEKAGIFLHAAQKLRANTVISALGYSLPNMIEDLSGLLSAVPATSLTTRNMSAGFFEFLGNGPMASVKAVEAKSGTMRAANDQLMRDLTRKIEELTAKGPLQLKPLRFLLQHAFVLLETSFKYTATPVWLGAYRQGLAESTASSAEQLELDAVTYADSIIRKAFPMHSAVNSAGIIRDKGFIGMSLMFYGFQSTALNNTLDLVHQFGESKDAWGKASAVGRMLGYLTAIAVVGGFLRGRGPEPEEKGDTWAAWYLRTMLLSSLQQLPFLGDAAHFIEAKLLDKPSASRPGLLGGAAVGLVSAIEAIADDKDADRKVEALLRALGPLIGIPTAQPLRTGKYLLDVWNDKTSIDGLADALSGGVYGEREGQALNPINVFSDRTTVPPLY